MADANKTRPWQWRSGAPARAAGWLSCCRSHVSPLSWKSAGPRLRPLTPPRSPGRRVNASLNQGEISPPRLPLAGQPQLPSANDHLSADQYGPQLSLDGYSTGAGNFRRHEFGSDFAAAACSCSFARCQDWQQSWAGKRPVAVAFTLLQPAAVSGQLAEWGVLGWSRCCEDAGQRVHRNPADQKFCSNLVLPAGFESARTAPEPDPLVGSCLANAPGPSGWGRMGRSTSQAVYTPASSWRLFGARQVLAAAVEA